MERGEDGCFQPSFSLFREKIFGFVQGEKEFLDYIRDGLKEAVKQIAVFQEKLSEGRVNGENKVPVVTLERV